MSDIGAAREVELPLEQPKERMFLDLTQWIITGLLVIGGLVLSWFLLPWLLELVPPGRQRFYAFVLYFAFVRIMVAVVMTRSFRKR
ncbi:MAG: hypothetical protein AAGJ34_04290 [Pseudomonadota bacterium]